MKDDPLRPDGFAIGLFVVGLLMFLIVPLTQVPGLIAMVLAICYWVIIAVVKLVHQRRA